MPSQYKHMGWTSFYHTGPVELFGQERRSCVFYRCCKTTNSKAIRRFHGYLVPDTIRVYVEAEVCENSGVAEKKMSELKIVNEILTANPHLKTSLSVAPTNLTQVEHIRCRRPGPRDHVHKGDKVIVQVIPPSCTGTVIVFDESPTADVDADSSSDFNSDLNIDCNNNFTCKGVCVLSYQSLAKNSTIPKGSNTLLHTLLQQFLTAAQSYSPKFDIAISRMRVVAVRGGYLITSVVLNKCRLPPNVTSGVLRQRRRKIRGRTTPRVCLFDQGCRSVVHVSTDVRLSRPHHNVRASPSAPPLSLIERPEEYSCESRESWTIPRNLGLYWEPQLLLIEPFFGDEHLCPCSESDVMNISDVFSGNDVALCGDHQDVFSITMTMSVTVRHRVQHEVCTDSDSESDSDDDRHSPPPSYRSLFPWSFLSVSDCPPPYSAI